MVTTDVELELTQQLKEAGKRLSSPQTSDDDLHHVLDQTEKLLCLVDQSPNDLMKEALNPLIKSLVDKTLLEHSNVDAKIAVASCLSEITRITAPEAPYNDEELKNVFRLIVSTFEDLSNKSSQSYIRRTTILETVCKVRSCVIMLDLECEDLIVEMFEHFFKSIRDHHDEDIFSNMVGIMELIFEESEDISVNMLKPLLSSIKNDNEGVLPEARKLGEKVLKKSGAILRPYLKQTLTILGDKLDNYSPVLTSICEGEFNFEQNDGTTLVQQQTDEEKLAKECSENAPQENVPQADEIKITTPSSGDANNVVKENAEKPAETVATPNRILKIVMSNGGKVARINKDSPVKDSSKKPEEPVDHQDSGLTSKVDTNDSVAEVANVESEPESNKESVKPCNSSHEKKDEKNDEIQVIVPEVESKPEETSSKDDVTMTSAENKDDNQVSVPESEAEAANVPSQSENLPEEGSVENVDLSNKQVSPQKEEAEVANAPPQVPEESNVEKVDVSNKEAEVANAESGGLPYKIHIRKGPRTKKNFIKDDTPLIDVIKKKASLARKDKDKTPAVTATSADDKPTTGSHAKVLIKKAEAVASGSKSEKKSGKKVGLKRKRKLSGMKSVGAKKSKQGGIGKSKTPTRSLKKDDESDDDSFDKPLRQSAEKEDGSDSDSKLIKSSVRKGNKNTSSVVKSSTKNKNGKKDASGKNVEEKDEAKEDGMDISPKTAVKTVTEEGKLEETPVTGSKRKRSVVKNNVKKSVKYDDSLIGKKVKVWWPDDQKYYEGVIESFDSAKNKHKVSYVDGDEERLNLKKEKWEILEEFSVRKKEKGGEGESNDDETLSKMITYKSKSKVNESTKSTGDGEETPAKSTVGSKSRRKRKSRA